MSVLRKYVFHVRNKIEFLLSSEFRSKKKLYYCGVQSHSLYTYTQKYIGTQISKQKMHICCESARVNGLNKNKSLNNNITLFFIIS